MSRCSWMPGPAHGPSGNEMLPLNRQRFLPLFHGTGIGNGIIGGDFLDCSICLARLGW